MTERQEALRRLKIHQIELKSVNNQIKNLDNPEWYVNTRRIHPERQIKVAMVRSSQMEAVAREFFATVAQDPELLTKRANILLSWHQQRLQ